MKIADTIAPSPRVQIRSNFNKKEKFTFRKTPARFESVSTNSLRRLKNACLKFAHKNYPEYDSNAAKAIFESTHDVYGAAYAELKSDYTTRLANLEKAYNKGLATAEAQCIKLGQLLKEHDSVLEAYRCKCEECGYEIPDQVMEKFTFDPQLVAEYSQTVQHLQAENAKKSVLSQQTEDLATRIKKISKKEL